MLDKNINDPNTYQSQASDPSASVWVSASAGTGKTKVLRDRVIRLLLNNVSPSSILCITYTNAAASEITTRIYDTLAQFRIMSDSNLNNELTLLLMREPSQSELTLARNLFYLVSNTQGGMRIQTIHSLCEKIIMRFTIETNTRPNAQVIDDTRKHMMLNSIIKNTFLHSSNNQDFINEVHNAGGGIESKLLNSMNHQATIYSILKAYENKQHRNQAIYKFFDINEEITEDDYIKNTLNVDLVEYTFKILNKYIQNKMNAKKITDITLLLQQALSEFKQHKYKLAHELLNNALFTKTNSIKKLASSTPSDIVDAFIKCAQHCTELNQKLKDIQSACFNTYFLDLVINIHNQYNNEKNFLGLLDFDDLLIKVYNLLKHSNMRQWVLYKLDGEIKHMLIDEAQDTSPIMWDIIKSLTEDFFSGEAVYNEDKTIFIVGDIKQSIYSFQGSDPEYYKEIKQYFANKVTNMQKKWIEVTMNTSFRSSQAVIDIVNLMSDKVFNNSKEVIYHNDDAKHYSFNNDMYGKTELWPILSTFSNKENTDISNEEHIEYISNLIVNKIQNLLKENTNIRLSDILILYAKRSNNKLLDNLYHKLENNNLPTSGIDRFNINKHIFIQDLISMGKVLLQPKDNFNLICLLKSPAFGLTEQDIIAIKLHDVTEKYLFNNLRHLKEYCNIYNTIIRWQNLAHSSLPFELFSYILYVDNIFNSAMQVFGAGIKELCSEFLSHASNIETYMHPNLENFIYFMDNNLSTIKRNPNTDINVINLQTIHGAKGLEAPIVFLLNAQNTQKSNHMQPTVIKSETNPLLLSLPIKQRCSNKLQELNNAIIKKQEQETMRLLYVGLTRAKNNLYIVDINNSPNTNPDYTVLMNKILKNELNDNYQAQSIPSLNSAVYDNLEDTTIKCFNSNTDNTIHEHSSINESTLDAKVTLPSWFNSKVNLDKQNNNNDDYVLDFQNLYDTHQEDNPKIIGELIHKLLEITPTEMTSPQDLTALLTLIMPNLKSQTYSKALDIYLKLKNNSAFEFLFKPYIKVLKEVSLIDQQNNNQILRADRIMVDKDKVIIVDYKFASYPNINHDHYIEKIKQYARLTKKIYYNCDTIMYILYLRDLYLYKV